MKYQFITRLTGAGLLLILLFLGTSFLTTNHPDITSFKSTLTAMPDKKFVHPGVMNTKTSLDFIASQANSGDKIRLAAYQKVLDFIKDNPIPEKFPDSVIVGSNGRTTASKSQIRLDAELAYAYALCWAQTGDMDYAKKSVAIINGWAYHFKGYGLMDGTPKTNPNQPGLEASWTTPTFVAAAEIIRYYKVKGGLVGWPEANIEQFKKYLRNVDENYISRIQSIGYNNNWNVSAGYAKMAIGVFLDDTGTYQKGIEVINNILPKVIKEDGTMFELCDRHDCVHYQYSLTGLTYAAEIAHIQGDNSLYTALDNRISAGYDFTLNAYNQTTGCNYCTASSPVFPGIEIAYRHYHSKSMEQLRNIAAPLGVPKDRTFLGFTTYTHYNVN